jgi:hypothetical protein
LEQNQNQKTKTKTTKWLGRGSKQQFNRTVTDSGSLASEKPLKKGTMMLFGGRWRSAPALSCAQAYTKDQGCGRETPKHIFDGVSIHFIWWLGA